MAFLTTVAEESSVNVTLIIVIAMFLAFAIIDGKRGFVKSVYALVGVVLAIILTIVITPYTGAILKNWDTPYNSVHEKVAGKVDLPDVEVYSQEQQDSVSGFLEKLHLPESVNARISTRGEELQLQADEAVKNAEEYLVDSITDIILDCIAFIVTFLLVFIAIRIVFGLLGLAAKLPVIKQADKILGVVIGIVECLFIITILSIAVTCISSTELGSSILDDIGSSGFLTFLYSNNWILAAIAGLSAVFKGD